MWVYIVSRIENNQNLFSKWNFYIVFIIYIITYLPKKNYLKLNIHKDNFWLIFSNLKYFHSIKHAAVKFILKRTKYFEWNRYVCIFVYANTPDLNTASYVRMMWNLCITHTSIFLLFCVFIKYTQNDAYIPIIYILQWLKFISHFLSSLKSKIYFNLNVKRIYLSLKSSNLWCTFDIPDRIIAHHITYWGDLIEIDTIETVINDTLWSTLCSRSSVFVTGGLVCVSRFHV